MKMVIAELGIECSHNHRVEGKRDSRADFEILSV